MSAPDFDELVGDDLAPEERARLRSVHDLLLAAGPPPESAPALAPVPRRGAFRLRRPLALALAAALAAAAFGAGWLARGGDEFEVRRAVPLEPTREAPGASALLELGYPDENGNWEMLVHVRGLRPLPDDGYYVLLLTKGGKPVATCGSFKVDADGETTARLGASYRLSAFDGWVVRPYVHDRDELNETVVLRTAAT